VSIYSIVSCAAVCNYVTLLCCTQITTVGFPSVFCQPALCVFVMWLLATKPPCVAVTRGVGCIFTEMVSGSATFPGTKDAWDQLDRIWQVSGCFLVRLASNSQLLFQLDAATFSNSRAIVIITYISDIFVSYTCLVRGVSHATCRKCSLQPSVCRFH